QLIDHDIDGVFQLLDFAAGVDGDLLREISVGDSCRDTGKIAHLIRQVRRHRVHTVGEIFRGSPNATDFSLSAQFAFGTDLASDAGDFRGKGVELIDHGIDGVLQFKNFAANVDRNLLGKIAVRYSRRDRGDVAHLGGEVAGHEVDAVGQ